MKCPECDDLLRQRLDGLAAADREALEMHLASCISCRDWHQAAQRLEEGLRALPRPIAPACLTERIVRQVIADRRERSRWQRRSVAVAAAACLLLTPLTVSLLGLMTGRTPAPESSRQAATRPADRHAPPPPTSLRDSVEEAGSAVASLTDRLAGQTREQARHLWTVAAPLDMPGVLPGLSALQTPLDPATQSLRDAGQGMSAGIATVASSARRALSCFARELPPLEHGRRSFD
jgi:hypothetical protein